MAHRARLVKASDFFKPWKQYAQKRIGKYVKCETCDEGSKRVPYGVKDRRMNRVTEIEEIEEIE